MGSEQPRRRENVDAIVAYFVGGVKDEAKSIGIELEHTLVKDGGEPVSYGDEFGQLWLLNQLGPEYDSEIRSSAGNLIGLLREGASTTLEPAAQVSYRPAPSTAWKTPSASSWRLRSALSASLTRMASAC